MDTKSKKVDSFKFLINILNEKFAFGVRDSIVKDYTNQNLIYYLKSSSWYNRYMKTPATSIKIAIERWLLSFEIKYVYNIDSIKLKI